MMVSVMDDKGEVIITTVCKISDDCEGKPLTNPLTPYEAFLSPFTCRLALKPNQLVDGAYILDSFPVKVYYKDGRIYAEMQTSTQVWQVNTADINPGEWSRVSDLSQPRAAATRTF